MADLSEVTKSVLLPTSQKPKGVESCVICTRIFMHFEAARAHVAFEDSLRTSAPSQWSLSWEVRSPDGPVEYLKVFFMAKHRGGYGWGIGGFDVFPSERKATPEHFPVVLAPLDPNPDDVDFSSTLSAGTVSLLSTWARECTESHTQCNLIFGSDATAWFPDRLLHIVTTDDSEVFESGLPSADVTTRLVLKTEFPADTAGVVYLSLSHCWGPPLVPGEVLDGRADTVLTQSKLQAWKADVPLHTLPLTFQHAIGVCLMLGCEYIWIDSLCIIQDSVDDWKAQSVVMGDVYKFAWLNIAALSSRSDYHGFVNDSRDPRVAFGFQAPFGSLCGQEDGLFRGAATLVWRTSTDIPETTTLNAPLFQRAWVYQERSLARRILSFTKLGIHWTCDESARSETSTGDAERLLRGTQHRAHGATTQLAKLREVPAAAKTRVQRALLEQLLDAFVDRWHFTIIDYTLCKLTKSTDKLIAISSVARELSSMTPIKMRYLAGLWDFNLVFQLGWLTVHGQTTPARVMPWETGYTAPSWSWASIDAPIQPRNPNYDAKLMTALAEVRAADIALDTDFVFGGVTAGWIRMSGRLRRVRSGKRMISQSTMVNSLTDAITWEELWFSSDTVEGIAVVSGRADQLLWVPLTLGIVAGAVSCSCLVVIEVQDSRARGNFVRDKEKVYRRLGSGNFGRTPSMLHKDMLLKSLGTFPVLGPDDDPKTKVIPGFKRSEEGYEEFVLI